MKLKLLKPPAIRPVQGTYWNPTPWPGAVFHGTYTPILKIGKAPNPRDQIAPVFEPPPKTRTTI